MCLAFVAIEQHSEFPLLLLFNRDEGYERPTLAAHWWEHDSIFAGRDSLKGGTWAAVSRTGRFAMITFIRGPREAHTPSRARGELVPLWVNSNRSYREFSQFLERSADEYLGYNILYGDSTNIRYYNNRDRSHVRLGQGIHGVSNGTLYSQWHKVDKGMHALASIVREEPSTWSSSCIRMLSDTTLAPDELVQDTGLGFEREKNKSSLFVATEEYGTVASSVIRYCKNGEIDVLERSYNANAECTSTVTERFRVL